MPREGEGKLTLEHGEGGAIMVSGTLDTNAVPHALESSRDWFRNDAALTINLSNVTDGDSAGVALLLEWLRRARSHHCTVRYVHVPEPIRAIAEFGELEDILQLEATGDGTGREL